MITIFLNQMPLRRILTIRIIYRSLKAENSVKHGTHRAVLIAVRNIQSIMWLCERIIWCTLPINFESASDHIPDSKHRPANRVWEKFTAREVLRVVGQLFTNHLPPRVNNASYAHNLTTSLIILGRTVRSINWSQCRWPLLEKLRWD